MSSSLRGAILLVLILCCSRAAQAQEPGPIQRVDAIEAALRAHPSLAHFPEEVRARESAAEQAGRRPNPELLVELENVAGSGEWNGFEALETTVALAQTFEFGGKRGHRRALARQERDVLAWEWEMARIDVVARANRAFVQVLAAQENVRLARQLVEVAEDVLASVARRVEAGSSSPAEASRARVELETTRVDLEQAARDLNAARIRLASMWGSATPEFTEAIGSLEELPGVPDPVELDERLAATPLFAWWTAELETRRAAAALERSLGTPDLTLGAGMRHARDTGDAAFLFEIALPLPVFDRNRAGSRAAEHELEAALKERQAALEEIKAALAVEREAVQAARAEIEAIRTRALPDAETAFAEARDAYSQGALRFTDVLDTERLLFRVRSRYTAALTRYHEAALDIEARLATALPAGPSMEETFE